MILEVIRRNKLHSASFAAMLQTSLCPDQHANTVQSSWEREEKLE